MSLRTLWAFGLAACFGLGAFFVTTVSAQTACSLYSNASTIPTGFAVPWNLFSTARELIASVSCSSSGATFTAGSGQNTQYVWKNAYYTKNGSSWEAPITLNGSNKTSDGNWIIGTATATIPLTTTELQTTNYFVPYVCSYVNNAWKCGCTSATACTTAGTWSLQQFRGSTPPTCNSFTYSAWGTCTNGTQTRTVTGSTPSGCTGGSPVLSQSCSTAPATCTAFTYSAWGTCTNGTQTRSVLTSTPSGCTGGSPVTSQSCTAAATLSTTLNSNVTTGTAPLTATLTATVGGTATGTTNYTFYCNRNDTGTNITTPDNGKYNTSSATTQTNTCTYSTAGTYTAKVIVERGGLAATQTQTITVAAPATCTAFTYSAWGTCTNGTQTRTVTGSTPSGCTGGSPVLSQSCSTGGTCNANTVTPSVNTQAAWDSKFSSRYGTSVPDLDGSAETFAWHQHYWIRAYVSMAVTFGDTKYLDKAVTAIDHMFANSDATMGWMITSPPNGSQQILDTAMISHGIMYFVYEAWKDPRFANYRTKADQYTTKLEPIMNYYNRQWVNNPPICSSLGSYIYSTCGGNNSLCGSGSILMYNQNATMAKAYLLLDRTKRLKGQTPDSAYLYKANAVADMFTKAATLQSDGSYYWRYAGCRTDVADKYGPLTEDTVDHGHIDLSLLVWANKFGIGGINSSVMNGLAKTMNKTLTGAGANNVSILVDGTMSPTSDWERVGIGYDWIDLNSADPTLLDKVIRVYNTHLADDTFSRSMLGWAEILRLSRCVDL